MKPYQAMGGSWETGVGVALWPPFIDTLALNEILECGLMGGAAGEWPTPVTHVEIIPVGGGLARAVVWCEQEVYWADDDGEPGGSVHEAFRALGSPRYFQSSTFSSANLEDTRGPLPQHNSKWASIRVFFVDKKPDSVNVIGADGSIVATGSVAANPLTSSWDNGRSSTWDTRTLPLESSLGKFIWYQSSAVYTRSL